jgi:glycosyltransferase involved in cell wall biosynthesis
MRVNHVVTTLDRGGAENQLLVLVRQQISQGQEFIVYPLKGQLELAHEFRLCGASVDTTFVNLNFIHQVIKARRLRFSGETIIHCHLPQAELLAAFGGWKNYIVTRHFGGPFWPNANATISRALSLFATREAHCVIAISKFVKKILVELGEVSSQEKIHVIYYGFDKENFLSGLNRCPEENEGMGRTIVGSIARLSVEKDLPVLVSAFAKLKANKHNPGLELRIFGAGDQEEYLRNLIHEYRLDGSAKLCGRTANPAFEMNKFSLFAFTSTFEGFGMVLLEAMALELPIVCANFEAAYEVLGNDGAAVFFRVGDSDDLAEKIQSWMEGNVIVSSSAQNKRLEFFNLSTLGRQTCEIYQLSLDSR